ncbi:hypothetical protein EN810_34740, partial [Mesorhizobium sp. M8A.F.Ca.ET.167.01.1.1]
QVERAIAIFRNPLSDPAVQEAIISPRGTRVIRQVAQGERGAHLLLRQIRFAVTTISADLVSKAVAEAQSLSEALAAGGATTAVHEAA